MVSPDVMKYAIALSLCAAATYAEPKVTIERHSNETPAFAFKSVPSPARNDAAAKGKFTVSDGSADRNGAGLEALNDGRFPSEEDQPARNFFFSAGSQGGKLLLDLGKVTPVKQINSYSWHTDSRAPQVYSVFGKGASGDFAKIATVDTTSLGSGGQVGVSIAEPNGILGEYQFLRFDVGVTERGNPFGHTFFSEIDVIDRDASATTEAASADEAKEIKKSIDFAGPDGTKYTFTMDSTKAPDLAEWADKNLLGIAKEWYPKLVAMLPSDGYQAPTNVTLRFRTDMGGTPASAGGNMINCNDTWFRNNLKGEAVGSVVHEMVHTVQQYGRSRNNPNRTRTPGWITEGIPDYIRWFLYEPESRGADITSRNLSRAKYDASYRVTGNFLNYVTLKYDKDLTKKLNAAAREGRYSEDIWKDSTGKTLTELGDEWHKANEDRLAKAAELTKLTEEEKSAGWKSLFNGADFTGWSNFKSSKVRLGWTVKDGVLICEDPHNASDLVTREEFDWFELQLEYNISPGGNSGIMYHVAREGGAPWASGPEVQLEDNAAAKDPQRCGWLYALYQPPTDSKTGKPLDATKPAGEWNQVRLVISPEKCEHYINGVKYFEYQLDSQDFKDRVAKSKFASMPLFAKNHKGAIALQGDHGQVSFRNIRIRPLNK